MQQGWGQPPRSQRACRRQGAPARVQQRARVYAAEVGAQQARAGVERGQRGRRAIRTRRARRRALVQHQHVRKLDLSRARLSAQGGGRRDTPQRSRRSWCARARMLACTAGTLRPARRQGRGGRRRGQARTPHGRLTPCRPAPRIRALPSAGRCPSEPWLGARRPRARMPHAGQCQPRNVPPPPNPILNPVPAGARARGRAWSASRPATERASPGPAPSARSARQPPPPASRSKLVASTTVTCAPAAPLHGALEPQEPWRRVTEQARGLRRARPAAPALRDACGAGAARPAGRTMASMAATSARLRPAPSGAKKAAATGMGSLTPARRPRGRGAWGQGACPRLTHASAGRRACMVPVAGARTGRLDDQVVEARQLRQRGHLLRAARGGRIKPYPTLNGRPRTLALRVPRGAD